MIVDRMEWLSRKIYLQSSAISWSQWRWAESLHDNFSYCVIFWACGRANGANAQRLSEFLHLISLRKRQDLLHRFKHWFYITKTCTLHCHSLTTQQIHIFKPCAWAESATKALQVRFFLSDITLEKFIKVRHTWNFNFLRDFIQICGKFLNILKLKQVKFQVLPQ